MALQAPPQVAADGSVVTVTSTDGLNLRAAPSTQAQILSVIPYGSVLNVTGQPTADGWYPVSFGNLSGWADGIYLTPGLVSPLTAQNAAPIAPSASTAPLTPASVNTIKATTATASAIMLTPPATPSPTSTPAPATLFVNTNALNLRAAANTQSQSLVLMPQGAAVQVTGPASANGWYPVLYNGTAGWADGAYLSTRLGGPSISPGANPSTVASGSSATPVASSGSGVITPSTSTGPLTAATFGNPTIGTPAPPESGLTPATAPASAQGMFIWPVAGPHHITTVFQPVHQAIDIDQFPSGGNPVQAAADGIVTFAGGDACCSYGLYVIIQHRNGFSSLYAHFSSLEVSAGQIVRQGQEIGRSGCTGFCSGPHLHFAIYYHNQPIDPVSVLPAGDATVMPGAQTALIDPSIYH